MSSDETEDEEREGEEGKGEGVEDVIGEYQGERNDDNERHGKGRTILPNGDYYEGQYRRNKRHGVGLYVFTKSGARYTGQYFNDIKSGIGTFYYPDGSIYEGEWKKNRKEGYGIYMYTNGDVYEGQWRADIKEGIGYYKYKDLPIKYMGTWRNGIMEGPGQAITSQYRYHGHWKDNLPLGKGCFTFGNEMMLHGFYIHQPEGPDLELSKERSYDEETSGENEKKPPTKTVPVWKSRELTKFDSEQLPVEPRPDDQPESEAETPSHASEPQSQVAPQDFFNELSLFDKIYVDEKKFTDIHSWDTEIVPDCTEPERPLFECEKDLRDGEEQNYLNQVENEDTAQGKTDEDQESDDGNVNSED